MSGNSSDVEPKLDEVTAAPPEKSSSTKEAYSDSGRDAESLKGGEVLDPFGNEEGAEVKCRFQEIRNYTCNANIIFRQDHDMVAGCAGYDRRKYLPRNSLSPSCSREGRVDWWFDRYHWTWNIFYIIWICLVAV